MRSTIHHRPSRPVEIAANDLCPVCGGDIGHEQPPVFLGYAEDGEPRILWVCGLQCAGKAAQQPDATFAAARENLVAALLPA